MGTAMRARLGAMALAGAGLMAMVTATEAAKLTVWSWDPNFNIAIMKEAGKRYAETHPDFELNAVDFAKKDVERKLQTGLASGVANALPDIVLIEDTAAQKFLQSFPGAFAPMNGKVDYSKFAPYKVSVATLQGKTYSMPFDSGVTGLFYRRDLLAAAGYQPADLQDLTWDKFIEIGKAVEAKTGKKMMTFDVNDVGIIRIMMQSAGRWYFDADGKPTIAGNPALKAALTTMQKIMQAKLYKPTSGWPDTVRNFTTGEVATVTAGVWVAGTIKSQADQAGKWGVAPIPKLDIPGGTHASNHGGSSWYVLDTSKQKDAAIAFLNDTFGKDEAFYQKILAERGAVGAFLPARGGPAYSATDAFFGGDPVWKNFSAWLAQVPSINYGIFTNEADAAVSARMPRIGQGADIDAIIKEIDADVASQVR